MLINVGCVSCGGGHCGAVEPADPAGCHAGVLGSGTEADVRAHGGSGDAGRPGVVEGTLAAEFGRQDQDRADGGAGRQ